MQAAKPRKPQENRGKSPPTISFPAIFRGECGPRRAEGTFRWGRNAWIAPRNRPPIGSRSTPISCSNSQCLPGRCRQAISARFEKAILFLRRRLRFVLEPAQTTAASARPRRELAASPERRREAESVAAMAVASKAWPLCTCSPGCRMVSLPRPKRSCKIRYHTELLRNTEFRGGGSGRGGGVCVSSGYPPRLALALRAAAPIVSVTRR